MLQTLKMIPTLIIYCSWFQVISPQFWLKNILAGNSEKKTVFFANIYNFLKNHKNKTANFNFKFIQTSITFLSMMLKTILFLFPLQIIFLLSLFHEINILPEFSTFFSRLWWRFNQTFISIHFQNTYSNLRNYSSANQKMQISASKWYLARFANNFLKNCQIWAS